jgi:NADP-dependent 3-hydroxy acid dehydrogenase YdfG
VVTGASSGIGLITAELQRQLDDAGSTVRALTAHPGIARTT